MEYDDNVLHGKIEVTGSEALFPYKVKYKGYKVVVYGTGSKACYIIGWLKRNHIAVEYVVDSNENKAGRDFIGYKVVWVGNLESILDKQQKYIALIAVSQHYYYNDILSKLYAVGIDEVQEIDKRHIFGNPEVNWQLYYINNQKRLIKFLEELGDDDSKQVLCEYIRTIFMDDFYRLPQLDSNQKYFGNGFVRKLENENFVCLGGSSGDTIFYFLDNYQKFGKIYCFEGDKEQIDFLKHNLKILPMEVGNKIKIIGKFVGNVTANNVIKLDDADVEDVTLISMDIEGMELEALYGGERIIREKRPILALSAYHKKEDILEFFEFISHCYDKYVFFLRKYASLHIMSKNELVLYAVPRERIEN